MKVNVDWGLTKKDLLYGACGCLGLYLIWAIALPVSGSLFWASYMSACDRGEGARYFNRMKYAAWLGHPLASYDYGYYLIKKVGSEEDPEHVNRGLSYLIDAAECDVVPAQFEIAHLSQNGYSSYIAEPLAVKWCFRAAENGHPLAQEWVSGYYQYGEYGFPKDVKKMLEWRVKAAESGCWQACLFLARDYETGANGLPKNQRLADEWRERARKLDEEGTDTARKCGIL